MDFIPNELEDFILSQLGEYSTLSRLVCKGWSIILCAKYTPIETAYAAARDGSLSVLELMFTTYPEHFISVEPPPKKNVTRGRTTKEIVETPFDKLVKLAGQNGHVDVLEWLIGKSKDLGPINCRATIQALNLAAYHGKINVLKWYHKADALMFRISASPHDYAAKGGQLETLKYLDELGIPCSYLSVIKAAQSGKAEVVQHVLSKCTGLDKYLCKHRVHRESCSSARCPEVYTILVGIAKSGNADLLELPHCQSIEDVKCFVPAIIAAAKYCNNHIIDILKYRCKGNLTLNSAPVWNAALKGNNIALLVELSGSGNIPKNIECKGAIANNSFEALLLLEQNSSSIYPIAGEAAKYGRLEIFIQAMRRPGNVQNVTLYLAKAAEYNQIHILKWYYEEHKGKRKTPGILSGAIKGGQVKVFMYLVSLNFKIDKCSCQEALNLCTGSLASKKLIEQYLKEH